MKNIKDYLSQFTPSSLDRKSAKYYSEMQQLAYNLVRYLRMNEDIHEGSCQGNYNLTYLEENLTEEDYLFVLDKMLRRIPMGKVRDMINENWNSESKDILLSRQLEDYCSTELLDELSSRHNIKTSHMHGLGDKDEEIYTFIVDDNIGIGNPKRD